MVKATLCYFGETEAGAIEERKEPVELPFFPVNGVQIELPEDNRGKVFLGVVNNVRYCVPNGELLVYLNTVRYAIPPAMARTLDADVTVTEVRLHKERLVFRMRPDDPSQETVDAWLPLAFLDDAVGSNYAKRAVAQIAVFLEAAGQREPRDEWQSLFTEGGWETLRWRSHEEVAETVGAMLTGKRIHVHREYLDGKNPYWRARAITQEVR